MLAVALDRLELITRPSAMRQGAAVSSTRKTTAGQRARYAAGSASREIAARIEREEEDEISNAFRARLRAIARFYNP